jgi:hypothetical protein
MRILRLYARACLESFHGAIRGRGIDADVQRIERAERLVCQFPVLGLTATGTQAEVPRSATSPSTA